MVTLETQQPRATSTSLVQQRDAQEGLNSPAVFLETAGVWYKQEWLCWGEALRAPAHQPVFWHKNTCRQLYQHAH